MIAYFFFFLIPIYCVLTTRSWLVNISGAIHPSVPVIPDLMENEPCPLGSCRQRPKSEMMARTSPRKFGCDRRTFCGLISRCTIDVIPQDGELENLLYHVHTNAKWMKVIDSWHCLMKQCQLSNLSLVKPPSLYILDEKFNIKIIFTY